MPAEAATVRPTRNAEATRARILAVARAAFVADGLNGARVDRIAEQAGVNKNLIYHYFDSKDDLYLEVLEGIYAELRAHQRDADLRGTPPVAAMTRLVGDTFDHFVATPDLIRLMSIENIHRGQYLRRLSSIKPLYRDLLDTLTDVLERGQAEGAFRRDVDTVDLYMSISGLAYFFLSNQHTLSWLLDRDFLAHGHVAARRRHVIDMVLSYLTRAPDGPDRAVPEEPSGSGRR
jgi:TetR/AcrR family transcriptional regulator